MKKAIGSLVSCLLIVTLFGCNSGTPSSSQPTAPQASVTAPTSSSAPAAEKSVQGNLIMATGGTSGTYYGYGGIIAQVLNAATGANITANSTGASVENVRLIASGDADIAFIQSDVVAYALDGINNFAETGKITNVKAMASLYPEIIHIVTVDPNINSISDLKGKAVSVGSAGSGDEANARHILDAYQMSYDDIDERFLSNAEAATALQDGTISAALYATGAPNPGLVELSVSKKIRLISLSDEAQKYLIDKCPYYIHYDLDKEIYGTDEGASSLAVRALLTVNESMSENDVYYLTKALFESQPEIAQLHAKGSLIALDDALMGILPGNLHPGAARYYTEMGIALPK